VISGGIVVPNSLYHYVQIAWWYIISQVAAINAVSNCLYSERDSRNTRRKNFLFIFTTHTWMAPSSTENLYGTL
jgi:hypothetical protein